MNQDTIQNWTQAELDALLEFINSKHDIESPTIYAVGSRIMGTQTEDSDIDIVLHSNEPFRILFKGEYDGVPITIYNKHRRQSMNLGKTHWPYYDMLTHVLYDQDDRDRSAIIRIEREEEI